MSNESIQELVQKLKQELSDTDIDHDTKQLLESFDGELQYVIDTTEDDQQESLMDTALDLEARFATEYPVAEGLIREVINALAKMGI